jgi:hypothetical protein
MGGKRKTKRFDLVNSIHKTPASDSAAFINSDHEQFSRHKRLALFDEFTRELGEEVEKRSLTEEQLMAELEETKREVFEERYGMVKRTVGGHPTS